MIGRVMPNNGMVGENVKFDRIRRITGYLAVYALAANAAALLLPRLEGVRNLSRKAWRTGKFSL